MPSPFRPGLWDAYHANARLQNWGANAWVADQFEGWDPCANGVSDEWNPGAPCTVAATGGCGLGSAPMW